LISKTAFPLKPLGQMIWNLVGSIYKISSLYRGPSIDVSYQVSVHLAKQFQRRIFLEKCPDQTIFFRNQPIRNKIFLWRPCLLTHREEMSNLNRGSSIDASYLVSVYLAKRILVSDWLIFKILLLWNRLAKWTEI
jgi:hypothetical protein